MHLSPAHDPSCPHPISEHPDQIGFQARPKMVDWLSPSQLADTGIKALIAATFGAYADKREVEAALAPIDTANDHEAYFDFSKRSELWFDYVADLGDGFNPTYAMAYLLAKEELLVDGYPTRCGELLLLGGDQVYPTANRDEYARKFIGPYRAALPWTAHPRDIFAIPGNHDWYDGLTSFLRIFCQSRWIGGWRARQRRSYFAIRLPHDWWIWGIDAQLESDLDKPQLDYFHELGTRMLQEERKQKIILVTPEPNWVYCGGTAAAPRRFDTLAHFESHYIRGRSDPERPDRGLQLAMTIAGDLHHYCRYTNPANGSYRITSGGGGAYLFPTHGMPETIEVPEEQSREYKRKVAMPVAKPGELPRDTVYPTEAKSRVLGTGVLAAAFRNRTFGLLLGCIYLLLVWSWGTAFSVLLGATVIAALWGYSYVERAAGPYVLSWSGILHGAVHVGAAALLRYVASHLSASSKAVTVVTAAPLLLAGGLLGATIFAAYIWLMSVTTGGHLNDVYSSMAIENYKHFLRFHVRDDETIEIYAIGVDDVPDSWRFNKDRTCGEPFFEPGAGKLEPRVVDGPFLAK